MRVLLMSQYAIPHAGGLSTHVVDLATSLRAGGHAVEIVAGPALDPSIPARMVRRVLHRGITEGYLGWHLKARLAATRRIVADRARRGVDVVHCHDPVVSLAAGEALRGMDPGRNARRPALVQTMHGPLAYEASMMAGRPIESSAYLRTLRDLEITAMRAADRVIAVDTGQARIARDDFGVDPARLTIIFNAVRCEEVVRIAAQPPRSAVLAPYFLVPRRLVEKTGVHVAIEAVSRMSQVVHLVVAGDGPLRERLAERAQALGIGARVQFLGSVSRDEVIRLGQRALGVLVPSVPTGGVIEATSLSALEAMACGTVLVASAIGGLAEVVSDGETGLLTPPGDAVALAAAMDRVATDEELRRRIGRRAAREVRDKLDAAQWSTRILRLYQEVLDAGSPKR